MTGPLSPATGTLLAKGAYDNGFDVERAGSGGWLAFASTRSPLWLWLGGAGDQGLVAAFSRRNVGQALTEHGRPFPCTLPDGALIARVVPDVSALHRMLRRAFQLSLALPDELLVKFQKRTAALPKSTEAERLVVQRVGQDLFRHGLLEYWEGRCAITGLAVPELLRASHIKPWAHCSSDAERLDIWNGLLLAPHLDVAFDLGFITVADDGAVLVSAALDAAARETLGLDEPLRVRALREGHRAYLPWHSERVFKGGQNG